MKITVCIGSSCHVKGSRDVIEKLEQLISQHHLEQEITLAGTFCMGNCQNGVNVMIDDRAYSLTPDTTEEFFRTEILKK